MNRYNRTSGFTIIELMVSLAILTVVLTITVTILINVFKINNSSGKDQVVLQVAKSFLEDVRTSWTGKSTLLANQANFDAQTLPSIPALGGYTCPTPTVTSVDPATLPNPRRKRVRIDCTTINGVTYSFVMEFGRPQ